MLFTVSVDMALESCEGGELFDQIARVRMWNLKITITFGLSFNDLNFSFTAMLSSLCVCRKVAFQRLKHAFMQQKWLRL